MSKITIYTNEQCPYCKQIKEELEYDECELMYLLLENRPIDALHTHSYTFHTANGRYIIETLKEKYYEHKD